ncbi:MAG: ATP synthase F1 subunit gamma [Muribaculaceae bacterium]|nr:ATP synthase F1 subunit gamma [Muribaculaceae bacterium]
MATLRELKGRIGSVASSEKITGAMKMISSAKMHKAEGELRRLKPYRDCIETIIGNVLQSDAVFSSPLTEVRPVETVTIAILGSDDGLCGAYNVNLAKFLAAHIAELRDKSTENLKFRIYPVGKKMRKIVNKLKSADIMVMEAAGVDSKSSGQVVKDFDEMLRTEFVSGETDAVEVIYMNYHSAGRQVATCDRLLPLSAEAFAASAGKATARPYIFEPGADAVFTTVLPMYLLSLTQEVFVENRASEQAARVMAMQSANDNAKKLQEQLSLEFNKLRQQSITTELLDIVGGQVRD